MAALSSMTGFGQACDELGVTAEVRSVNHRHLDIACHLPKPWQALEGAIRTEVSRHMTRGRVELSVRYLPPAGEGGMRIDTAQAARYLEWARSLAGTDPAALRVDGVQLLALPGVLSPLDRPEIGEQDLKSRVIAVTGRACQAVVGMRRQEGDALEREIAERLAEIGAAVGRLKERVPAMVHALNERLGSRLAALCADAPVDAARLAQEAAILAERSDVTEELARLESHIGQFRAFLTEGGAVGRSLDFLLVEMNREANTTGAKCQDARMAQEVIHIKCEIEKVREQVQNVE